jgi:hypothetical protein
MNVTKIDIEKLDMLPSRQKFSDVLIRTHIERRKEYKYGVSRNFYLAKKIFDSGVGKDANEILNKVRHLLRNYNQGPSWFEEQIHKTVYENGKLTYLVDHYGRWTNYGHYVDGKGILRNREWSFRGRRHREFKATAKRGVITWRDHYERIRDKKKSSKQHDIRQEKRELMLLAMINKPQVYYFYVKLTREVFDLEKSIDKYKWYGKTDREKLARMKNELKRLEGGDYTGYYESDTYLYSQQKECHHFGKTPHKQIEHGVDRLSSGRS